MALLDQAQDESSKVYKKSPGTNSASKVYPVGELSPLCQP